MAMVVAEDIPVVDIWAVGTSAVDTWVGAILAEAMSVGSAVAISTAGMWVRSILAGLNTSVVVSILVAPNTWERSISGLNTWGLNISAGCNNIFSTMESSRSIRTLSGPSSTSFTTVCNSIWVTIPFTA